MNKLLKSSKKIIDKNGSTILTILGVIGVIGTSVMVMKATPKVTDIVTKKEKERDEKISKWEYIKIVYPVYIPAMIMGLATIGCIIGANILNKQSQASLASAYALLDRSYKEYRNKLKELYGEEAHANIIDSIAIDNSKDVHISCEAMFSYCDLSVENNNGEPILFYDAFSKRYFKKTIEQVLSAEYHTNRNFTLAGELCVNEFYEFMGLNQIEGGEDLVWVVCEEYTWIDFNHRKVILDDNQECYIIEMISEPKLEEEYDY